MRCHKHLRDLPRISLQIGVVCVDTLCGAQRNTCIPPADLRRIWDCCTSNVQSQKTIHHNISLKHWWLICRYLSKCALVTRGYIIIQCLRRQRSLIMQNKSLMNMLYCSSRAIGQALLWKHAAGTRKRAPPRSSGRTVRVRRRARFVKK